MISAREYREMVNAPKSAKYGNRKTVVDGYTFDSKAEAMRYGELLIRERAGEIKQITLQPVFHLVVKGQLVCKYRGDFEYFENGKQIIEDVKGKATPAYRIKAKLFRALFPAIELREISA